MTTFTVGLGVSGTLNYRADYKSSGIVTGDFADIRTGAKNWPVWPDPALNYDPATGGSYANWNNPQVDRRLLAHRSQRPRHLLQCQAARIARHRTGGRPGRRGDSHRLRKRHHGVELHARQRRQLRVHDDLHHRQVDGRRAGIQHRRVDRCLSPTANWSAMLKLDTATGAACDNRNIYLFRAGATDNKVNFTWGTPALRRARQPDRGAEHRPERHRAGVLRQCQRLEPGPVPGDDRRNGGNGRPAHAGGGRQPGQLPARPARIRRLRHQ